MPVRSITDKAQVIICLCTLQILSVICGKGRTHDFTLFKQSKLRILTEILKIKIEHVNRRCKIFRIVKATYRGKHKHYRKTWTVVATLGNLRYTP
jgi:hypothetical protein